MKLFRAFGFLALTLFSFASSAQNTFDIIGLALDSATQKPIPNVSVSIIRTNINTNTDVDGSFNIRYVRQGRYRLLFTHEKYDTLVHSLDLKKNIRQTFYLQKTAPPVASPTIDTTAKDTIAPLVETGKRKKARSPKAKKGSVANMKAPSEGDVKDLIVQMVDYREIYVDEIKWNRKESYWEATGFFVIETLGLYEFEAEISHRTDGSYVLKEFEAEVAKTRKEKKK